MVDALEAARVALRDRLPRGRQPRLGPRFLHSTGQLHKGGPPAIVCVQVVGDDPTRSRSPASRSGSVTSSGRRPPATCAPCRPAGSGPAASPSHELLAVATMKLGMVGLGRMGGNMAERLRAHGHEVVGYDVFSDATDVATLEELVAALADAARSCG